MINLQAAGLPGEGRDGKNVVGDEAEWMSRQYLLFCLCLIFFITNVSHNYMPLFSQFSTLSSNNRNTECNDASSCGGEWSDGNYAFSCRGEWIYGNDGASSGKGEWALCG